MPLEITVLLPSDASRYFPSLTPWRRGSTQDMINSGCERSVITYSSLITACEKAGQWETALDLLGRMYQDGCRPNTITYNSLISACAQGVGIDTFADGKSPAFDVRC